MRRLKWWVRGLGQRLFPRTTLAILANRTWLLEPEIALLPLLTDRKGVAVDAGANKGVYLFHLSRIFQRVLAFEPLPDMAAYLKKAAPRNVRVEPRALSNSAGHATLRLPRGYNELASLEPHTGDPDWNSTSQIVEHDVELAPLDALGVRDVNLIKIDVEGHELSVLEGARGTLLRCRPALLIEVEERHNANGVARVEGYLKALGYQGFFLDGGALKPIASFDRMRDQNRAALENSVRVARYINNFIFFQGREAAERVAIIEAALARGQQIRTRADVDAGVPVGAREKLLNSFRAARDAFSVR